MNILEIIDTHDGDRYFAGPQIEQAWHEARNPASRTTIAYMSPTAFISVAEPGYDPAKMTRVQSFLKRGQPFPTLPFMGFDQNGKVLSHEGRHRVRALHILGVHAVPVILRSSILRWGQHNYPVPEMLLPQTTGTPVPMPASAIFPPSTVTEGMVERERLFHGSPNPNITQFTTEGLRNRTGTPGTISFTTQIENARVFGPYIYEVAVSGNFGDYLDGSDVEKVFNWRWPAHWASVGPRYPEEEREAAMPVVAQRLHDEIARGQYSLWENIPLWRDQHWDGAYAFEAGVRNLIVGKTANIELIKRIA